MYRLSIVFLSMLVLLPLFTAPAAAQTPGEIDTLQKAMRTAGETFRGLVQNLTDEQWNFLSSGSPHTIGHVAEHVALSENDLQRIVDRAIQAGQVPDAAKSLQGKEDKIRDLMLSPDTAAESYKPRNKLNTKAEALEYFNRAHNRALQGASKTPDLDLYVFRHPHPDYSDLTALQWYYYIAYHNLRHCKQIEAIMADANFPGGPRKP